MSEIRGTDFQVAACQATLFTPEGGISTTQLFTKLYAAWSSRFDGEPVLLPSAEGLPPEVPRIILQDVSGEWRCEIGATRINLHWRQATTSTAAVSISAFYRHASDYLLQYFTVLNRRVGRVAAVLGRYAIHPSPGIYLSQHFCKERWQVAPFNRPESFELHAHKKYTFSGTGYSVNSWVRNKTATVATTTGNSTAIFVEQDLNTLAEEADARAFTGDEITQFFSRCVAEFDQILGLYYPGE